MVLLAKTLAVVVTNDESADLFHHSLRFCMLEAKDTGRCERCYGAIPEVRCLS